MPATAAVPGHRPPGLIMPMPPAAVPPATTAPPHTGKNTQHIQTNNLCEDCHSNTSWTPVVRVDHADVIGTCFSCHNGTTATGKHAQHITSGNSCDDCHTSNAWTPANFDHANVTGSCFSPATTVHHRHRQDGPDHIQSGTTCDDCHTSTMAGRRRAFDHATVTGNCCSSCHNGTTATGKHTTHIQTTRTCARTATPARPPGHQCCRSIIPPCTGSCFSCHNGTTATGKTPITLPAATTCDDCHTTNAWTPAVFDHAMSPATAAVATTAPPPPASTSSTSRPITVCEDCHQHHHLVTGAAG